MRKLVLKMSVSLDGFVSGPNGEIDWIFRSSSPDSLEPLVSLLRQAGAHAMGSRTYYDMAAFWPYSASPLADSMNQLPKIVFARHGIKDGTQVDATTRALADARRDSIGQRAVTPTEAVLQSWAKPAVASGDMAEEVARLKEQPGNFILAHGGARFAQSLIATGLIDEYRLVVHPVALGRGLPLFSGLHQPIDLRLVSATAYGGGVVGTVYHPA
jgi:dihydrofolate reductase